MSLAPFVPSPPNVVDEMLQLAELKKDEMLFDLGCGDGILGRAILSEYPEATGVFLDFSDTMIEAARQKNPKSNRRLHFVTEDFGEPSWIKSVSRYGLFDVIVSGLSILLLAT